MILKWVPRVLLWASFFGFSACLLSPASAPAPVAEIPSLLEVPQNLSIEVNELDTSPAPAGLTLGSGIKLTSITSNDIKNAIEGTEIINQSNALLDSVLFVVSQREIPVDVSVFNFAYDFIFEEMTFEVKLDFGIFDLDGDGSPESCTGCTCPVGCAPNLVSCPSQVEETKLQPICLRAWVNGNRFFAALFDRVPTSENPQSGQIRVLVPEFFQDLAGTNIAINYDHRDPLNLTTDDSQFLKDPEVGPDFFSRNRTVINQEGPESEAKKTPRFQSQLFDDQNSTYSFQGQFFSNLDFILLEAIATGSFKSVAGLVDITPPLCAQISTNEPVSQVLCDDLGLLLTPGNFPPLPEFSEIAFPPIGQFPANPTF